MIARPGAGAGPARGGAAPPAAQSGLRRRPPRAEPQGPWTAAVLACGPDALLSHGSAAALWGIGPEWKLIEVTVRRRAGPNHDGLEVRSRPSLPSQDVIVHESIPVTTPPRTILDQAALPISDAELERLFRPIALAAGLPPRPGPHG